MRARANRVRFRHPESRNRGEEREGERHQPGRGGIGEMIGLRSESENDEREFAHLAEVDRGNDAGAQTLPHEIERSESRYAAAHHDEGREDQRPADQDRRRHRNLHPEADEKQSHEKIAQARHLRRDIERVGEGGERDARDERAHFAREMEPFAQFADEKTPGQRADLDQFGRARDAPENRRQHITTNEQRGGDEQHDPHERQKRECRARDFPGSAGRRGKESPPDPAARARRG